jgi:hypothetical protein
MEVPIPPGIRNVESAWPESELVFEEPQQSSVDRANVDEGLMAYLRNAQWPLVPLVAGLAYAVTRSIDQQAEAPEPKTMAMRRRSKMRLPTGR